MSVLTRARDPVASAVRDRVEIDAAPLRSCLCEEKRCPRWSVHLVTMVHLQHLDIPVRTEFGGSFTNEMRQQIDAWRHVRRLQHGEVAGRLVDQALMIGGEPR